jgi:hypothetical protein
MRYRGGSLFGKANGGDRRPEQAPPDTEPARIRAGSRPNAMTATKEVER